MSRFLYCFTALIVLLHAGVSAQTPQPSIQTGQTPTVSNDNGASPIGSDETQVSVAKQRLLYTSIQKHIAKINTSIQGHTDKITSRPQLLGSSLTYLGSIGASVSTLSARSAIPMSKQAYDSIQASDVLLKMIGAKKKLTGSDYERLADVADDLSIKADCCRMLWPVGGVKDISVEVHTIKGGNTDIGGCMVTCVAAGWYKMPGQGKQEYNFSLPSSPSIDNIPPGVYWWWSTDSAGTKHGRPMKKRIKLVLENGKVQPSEIAIPAP